MRHRAGRTAKITGISCGIGVQIAHAGSQVNVMLAPRPASEVEAVAADLKQTGQQCWLSQSMYPSSRL
jgi:short-subunit dehydrogenase